MKVAKRMDVATLCGAVMLLTALACGSPAADNQASGPEPWETDIVRQSPDRRATEEPAQVASQPTETLGQGVVVITTTRSVPTITAPAPTMTATEEATATPRAEATSLADGQVYVAPKKEPTDTPEPTQLPTREAKPEPPTIWDKFTREEYQALIPDPALGVFWGHQFDKHDNRPFNTTPDGIRQNFDTTHPPFEMMHTLADKMLEGVSGTEELFGEWNFYKTGYRIKRAAAQWEWVHPEIPLARMIIEGEFYKEGTILNPEIVVWRGGAHFIMKDTHTPPPAQGQVWSTRYEPELIGPVVVEQTTCEGLFMPYHRHPTLGARCSP